MSDWNQNTQKLLALKKKKFKKKEPEPPKEPEFYPKDEIFEYAQKDDFFQEDRKEELSEIVNSKQSQGELLINEFLDDEQLEFDFFGAKSTNKKVEKPEKVVNTRDVHFLIEKYKEENGGKGTDDICILFSYWQINFAPEDKTLINYNSKSFNNKTYFNRPVSMDRSPLEFNLDPIDQGSEESEKKPIPNKFSAGKKQDSILFSQKMIEDEVHLGNVKNQILGGYQHKQKKSFGREIDRNQLSAEIMNITPIMEEKIHKNESSDKQVNFSFDKDFNFPNFDFKKAKINVKQQGLLRSQFKYYCHYIEYLRAINPRFCVNISAIFNIQILISPRVKIASKSFLKHMFVQNSQDFLKLSKTCNYLNFSLWAFSLSRIPKSVGFDVLSSIDSGDNADDQDEVEVLNVLEIKKKNDDQEYKMREMKNLNKYRDKSQFSNKSDMATFKGLKNEIEYKSDRKKDKSKRRKRGRNDSSKSKSKSRFSTNMGYTQLQKEIEDHDALDNTQDIEKLLEEIDNDKNELDKFISREEENYSKKFNNKLSEAERVLQNSRREGSHKNMRDAHNVQNFQQNQHHNSISNNSGSFYFNINKKQNLPQQTQNDYSSSSRSRSHSSEYYLRPSQIYNQTSRLLTDRPILGKQERQVSIISGNEMNKSYQNKQRFLFQNNEHQYSSVSRIGGGSSPHSNQKLINNLSNNGSAIKNRTSANISGFMTNSCQQNPILLKLQSTQMSRGQNPGSILMQTQEFSSLSQRQHTSSIITPKNGGIRKPVVKNISLKEESPIFKLGEQQEEPKKISIAMLKNEGGAHSSRVPVIGKFGNSATINTSGSKLKIKSSRGVKPTTQTSVDQNSSTSSAKKLKIKLKPRNFQKQEEQPKNHVRRSRGLRSSFNTNKPVSPSYNNTQRQPVNYSNKLGEKQQNSQVNSTLNQTDNSLFNTTKQQQSLVQQQYYAKRGAGGDTSLEIQETDRLLVLLINEYKRKKGKNIKTDIQPCDQLSTLMNFWSESLSKPRILLKLQIKKEDQSHNKTATSMSSKLSDKEKWLLAYLEGTDRTQLMKLGKDSTTRNYGELACIGEKKLAMEITRYLGLQDLSYQDQDQNRQNLQDEKAIYFQFFIN